MRLPNESEVVACPHPKCRRKIEEPILLNCLSTSPEEQYYACPYCFTKLDVDVEKAQPPRQVEEEEEEPTIEPLEKEQPTIKPLEEEEPTVEPPQREVKAPSGCTHRFGYLAKRPKNDPIPQECLTCSKIVDCMLKMSDAK